MDTNFTPIENYPFLSRFLLPEDYKKHQEHRDALLKQLDERWQRNKIKVKQTQEYLAAREKVFADVISEYYQDQYKILVEESLNIENSFEILSQNTHLLDSIIKTAFEYAITDLQILKERINADLKKEYQFAKKSLPNKKKKLDHTRDEIKKIESNQDDPDQRQMFKYYRNIEADLTNEIEKQNERLKELKVQLPQISKSTLEREFLLNHFVIFARGGYGRAELSFASDKDLGYCLDTQQLNAAEAEICRQFIVHIEHLLRKAGIETAHQYFELNEDLSRFKDPSTIHTIPSILESRVLLGSKNLVNALKRRFFQILPYEAFVLSQIREYDERTVPDLNQMNLKEDKGGLRSLQIPLWLTAATFGVFPSQTAEMLALLIQKRIISPRQGFKLCQALEFFYDLRNFSATAKKFHFDDEARESGLSDFEIQPNMINDATERLYLLKKNRFQSIDDFDRYRLQMLNYIEYFSQAILQRLLDRTIVRTFSNFQVVVHLGKRLIMEVNALEGLPQVPISLIFNDPCALLELFEYVGQSDYDLSFDLKDEMADLIRILTPDVIEANRTNIAECFSIIMLAPFAANTFRIMFEICEPINEDNQPHTLIGCFIPETNKMRFLLRNLADHQHPVCTHTLNALDKSQRELDRLKKDYQELHQYLEPKHIIALKWGVLFHDLGKIDPHADHEVSGTSVAVKALEKIGYQDQELFTLVSLLIVHHSTVVQLSRTSAYFDQALQNFFEIADRNLINIILIFLCNISDFSSVNESNARSTRGLRAFFDETYRVFAEMRSSKLPEESMEFINTYLDIKKNDLESDTRIDLLINRSLRNNLESVLFTPLEKINTEERKNLQKSEDELHILWRDLKLGSLDKIGTDQTTDKFIRTIRQSISKKTLESLTERYNPMINWFFAAFPNRFLLSSPPGMLAENLSIFNKLDRSAIVNVITNAKGKLNGLLIYVHDQPQIHSRIAYTLKLKHINIESAKINQIQFTSGQAAFCYYLKVSRSDEDNVIFPRELETSIKSNTLPSLNFTSQTFLYNTKLHLEYLEDDKKGYVVRETNNKASGDFPVWNSKSLDKTEFSRQDKNYLRIKITAEDAPMVYYKMVSAFDHVQVPIQQAVITTIGHQVIDTFYITPSDHKKIVKSDFEESLKQVLMSPSEI
ncbi:MAG: Bifunctional uridylyltransferase/uridylyl-removing enzyme [Deltaproteobacteria bacterium]|nr:Bifunctional uridylyltransferase/uridylyl-removing enzyme [Deltaproteobacteria bacterium]